LWVPWPDEDFVYNEGTHKGCPYSDGEICSRP
jgi:hypothetical protein